METESNWQASPLRLRPTFELRLPLSVEQVDQAIKVILASEPWKATSAVFDRYAELHVPEKERRFWSPHLSLYLESDDRGEGIGTRIFGRFAPRQEVWTLVWVAYLALAFSTFFSLIYVYAVSLLKQSTWMAIVPVASILGIIILHLASRIGQSLSTDQMHSLRKQSEQLLEEITKSV